MHAVDTFIISYRPHKSWSDNKLFSPENIYAHIICIRLSKGKGWITWTDLVVPFSQRASVHAQQLPKALMRDVSSSIHRTRSYKKYVAFTSMY